MTMHGSRREDECQQSGEPALLRQPQPGGEGPEIVTVCAPLIEVEGRIFKDLARTGELLPYEDWRLDASTRAADLAGRLSVEQIAGLMLYSPHQTVPALPDDPFPGTYGGKDYDASGARPWDLTDQQRRMLADGVRHVLVMNLQDAATAARWNNAMQAFCEALPLGIPVNASSDPRNGAAEASAEFKGGAGGVSRWPEGLGMAALFDPERMRECASIISREYRALGIVTALGPQIDLGTEPRWMRLEDTWGPHSRLVTDYAAAYCDGMQTSQIPCDECVGEAGTVSRTDPGWGRHSVAVMVKHWPGGGSGEAGRDAHYGFGKFAVYPAGNEAEHLQPFTEGAFRLPGPTGCAAAVMPYYSIAWGYEGGNDGRDGQTPRGNSYNRYLIHGLLRGHCGYDGVVCTDWGVTADPDPEIGEFGKRCYGVEDMSVAERHLLAIDNGVDQFGGNSDIGPILEAYRLMARRDGQRMARDRFEASATRLLRTSFRCGLFENPYLDPESSTATVGRADFTSTGKAAQRDSLVLLKNRPVGVSGVAGSRAPSADSAANVSESAVHPTLPLTSDATVYVPTLHREDSLSFFRTPVAAHDVDPLRVDSCPLRRTHDPRKADVAVVFIESPLSNPYSVDDREKGGNGYLPLTLQYRPYTARTARQRSIASGDFRESADRGYRDKTNRAVNASDLNAVLQARADMEEKPVIVVVRMHNPAVLAEFEPYVDAIIVDFGVEQDAVWELLTGAFAPSGLLPLALPTDMEAVEAHCEDLPFDYEPYADTEGNAYDFGYGMSFGGVIDDDRTHRYTMKRGGE